MIFNQVTVFGLHLSNIVIVFLVMLLGWKNGMLVGSVTGLSMGLILSMIELQNGLQIAVFAVSGILAGILNKFGKIGVIVGFMLGNSLLIYLSSGDTLKIVYFREIFIAALGLLLVPNHVKIEIEDLVGKNKLLSDLGENRLSQNEEMINKLNMISDTISEMVLDSQEEIGELIEDFKDILFGNLEEIEMNMFCEDILNEDTKMVDDIYGALQVNDIVLESDLIEIFKNHNNYIIVQDEMIKNDLQEIIKMINRSYKMLQIEVTKKQEKNKNAKSVKKSFENVSKAIKKSIATNEKSAKTKFSKKEKELLILLKNKFQYVVSVEIKQAQNKKYIVDIAFANDKSKDKQAIASIATMLSKALNAEIEFAKEDSKKANYVQTYMSEDKFVLKVGSSKVTKEESTVSGDCNLQMRLQDGKYLLVQENHGKVKGKWNYPSGRLETGELLMEGAKREIREECGFEVELTGICQIGTHRFPTEPFAMVVFTTRVTGGEVVIDQIEISDAKWFSYEELLEMKDSLRNSDRILNAIDHVRNGVIAPMELIKFYENSEDLKGPMTRS